jgi:isopentenyl-diphosphate delta-isomerase
MRIEKVILVDEKDSPVGEMEKMEAHARGLLHRAFSGFIFNDKKQLLIQRRAWGKYHNPGVWSNTVCSHPRPNELTLNAVKRRISDELGFESDFQPAGAMIYKHIFPNGLIEHEYDHIFVALYRGQAIKPDPAEVCAYRWISRVELEHEIATVPENLSYWLREILRRHFLDDWF